jgi:5,5'-dehydrodivanillate O-demethylase oxygenase subunit
MLSSDDNRLLTQTGPGTPGGELLRRYWQPLCPVSELTADKPKIRLRRLGEDLVLFRDGGGNIGLVAEQCRHRQASLYYGYIEDDGLRCPYHGWKFDTSGACIERPFEKNKNGRIENCQRAYPVQSLGGILFGYLGPAPAPLLPRWENLVRRDGRRMIRVLPIHNCNWLQAQENSCDPVHTYWLHAHRLKLLGRNRRLQAYFGRPIEGYEFELCHEAGWSGVRKIRIFGGDRPEREVGHPSIFPHVLMSPQEGALVTHMRAPIDDTHTYILFAEFAPSPDGVDVEQRDQDIPVEYVDHPLGADGEYDLGTFIAQDLMAWETQGAIADRSRELLGAPDRGIIMFRNLLREQIEIVRNGGEPVGVIRDSAVNEIIRFSLSKGQERSKRYGAAE